MSAKQSTQNISCPYCKSHHAKATHTYRITEYIQTRAVVTTRRRRICSGCGLPFTTVEVPEELLSTYAKVSNGLGC